MMKQKNLIQPHKTPDRDTAAIRAKWCFIR